MRPRNGTRVLAALLACVLTLAGCTPLPTPLVREPVDWAAAPAVRIRDLPDGMAPGRVVLARGAPVRLVLTNGFGPTTDFVSTIFNNVRYRPGTLNPGVLVRLEPAQHREFDIVPDRAGSYSLSAIIVQADGNPITGSIVVR